jgi:hypothetical protein
VRWFFGLSVLSGVERKDLKTVFVWHVIKGIVRAFEFVGRTRLIRPAIINWRPGKFFLMLMIQSHEKSIKPFTAGLSGWPFTMKVNYRRFTIPGKSILKFLSILEYDKLDDLECWFYQILY